MTWFVMKYNLKDPDSTIKYFINDPLLDRSSLYDYNSIEHLIEELNNLETNDNSEEDSLEFEFKLQIPLEFIVDKKYPNTS